MDLPILNAWHNCSRTAVVAVGSCDSVRECVSVFRDQPVTTGLEAFGYIDRDAWPDSHLDADQFVKALPVSEIEGLFCIESIFKALAIHNGSDAATAQKQFDAFAAEARSAFKDALLNKQILERAKMRVEIEQKALLNPIRPNPDLRVVRTAFAAAAPPSGWPAYLHTVFAEEESRLGASLTGPASNFLKDFPAKSYLNVAARHLKLVPEKMVEVLRNALMLSDAEAVKEERLKALRDSIVPTIQTFLWPRKA